MLTHEGFLIIPGGTGIKVLLRETNKYWISESGNRYRKVGGNPTGNKYPCAGRLDLDSIKVI